MQGLPSASIALHKLVTNIGPWVGIASIFAVALLILLFFAHARETASLRERLEEAQQRIGGLEARLAQVLQQTARGRVPGTVGQPGAPAVTPAPAGVRPLGAVPGAVRRVPSPMTAAAAPAGAAAGVRSLAAPVAGGLLLAAPVGIAAPALGSATKLIPDPERPAMVSDDTLFVPAAAAAAARNGQGAPAAAPPAAAPPAAAVPATVGAPTEAMTAVSAPAPAAPASPPTPPRTRGSGPPRVQFGADGESPAPRRTVPLQPPALQSVSADSAVGRDDGRRRWFAGRTLPTVVAVIAAIVIIAGLVKITTNGSSSATKPSRSTTTSSETGANVAQKQRQAVAFKPSRVNVAVLNSTGTSGLAGVIGDNLASAGYRKGNITNGPTETAQLTYVYYAPGASAATNKTAAKHIATTLGLPPRAWHPRSSRSSRAVR